MSFNRPLYDYCEGKKRIQESTQAANYNVQTPVICGNCLPNDPRIHPNRTGVSMNSGVDWRFYAGPIDVESDLFNLNRVASNCPKNKYYPDAKNCKAINQGQPAGAGVISTTMPARGGGIVEGFESKPKEGLFRKNGQRCTDNNLVDFMRFIFLTFQLKLDFVYTAKSMYALYLGDLDAYIKPSDKVLFIHTGGLQDNRGAEAMNEIFKL
jgi:hypothetical protein